MLPLETLRRQFMYDPLTGAIYATEQHPTYARRGQRVDFFDNRSGYRKLFAGGQPWLAHRFAWYLRTGEQPYELDHLNGNKGDNCWANLHAAKGNWNSLNNKVQRRLEFEARFHHLPI